MNKIRQPSNNSVYKCFDCFAKSSGIDLIMRLSKVIDYVPKKY